MERVVGLVILGATLALLKAAVQVLAVALLLALLVAFVTRPRETLVFVVVVTLCGLASVRPTAAIIAFGIVTGLIGIAGVMGGPKPKAQARLLVDDASGRSAD